MGTDVLKFLDPLNPRHPRLISLFPLSGLGVLRSGTFRRLRGSRREKDPIEDGCGYGRKENDRQQGVLRGNWIQANAGVGGAPSWRCASDFEIEIGLEFSRHRVAAYRVRCDKKKLLPRQAPTFSAVRRGEFINN